MSFLSGAGMLMIVLSSMISMMFAWAVTRNYTKNMVRLMRQASPPDMQQTEGTPEHPPLLNLRHASCAFPNWRQHVEHRSRIALLLAAMSLLVAGTQAVLSLHFTFQVELSGWRWLVVTAAFLWPLWMSWAVLYRWPWRKLWLSLAGWMLASLGLAFWRSSEETTIGMLILWLSGAMIVPCICMLLLTAKPRIRSIAPWLLPGSVLLVASSYMSLQWMNTLIQFHPDVIIAILSVLPNATWVWALFLLTPWLLLLWPLYRAAHWLADCYQKRYFSELSWSVGLFWLIAISWQSLISLDNVGAINACIPLLAWLWIPSLWWMARDWLAMPTAAPVLLVLRVFQRDAEVEALFDSVIHDWRNSGNCVLIAGSDTVASTFDPADMFRFIGGQMEKQYIQTIDEIPLRIGKLERSADHDGRYRLNEFYCYEHTWKTTLRALLQCSDLVLMDLRGLRTENRGCLYELEQLAQADGIRRIVLLVDRSTDKEAARQALGEASTSQRIHWLDMDHLPDSGSESIVRALLR